MNNITTTFQLSGLHCESCKKISEKRVKKIEDVTEATTNLETGDLTVIGNRSIAKEQTTKSTKEQYEYTHI
jgi:cation transport ATPase